MGEQPARGSNRLPGLDGLRAVSVGFVIFLHLGSMSYFPQNRLLKAISDEGAFGVQIFFVISGFLITWLLLMEEKKRGRIDLGKFYIRRALRILPPAIAFLLGLKLLAAFGMVPVGWHDVLYAMLFIRNVLPGPTITNHFWSLAIEEQFYLAWPFLVVLLPSRQRLLMIVASIAAVPVWRYLHDAGLFGFTEISIWRFDVACDGLLMGCLLAMLRQHPRFGPILRGRWLQSMWTLAAAAVICVVAIKQPFHAAAISRGFLQTIKSAVIAVIINFIVEGHRTWIDLFLGLGLVAWLGRLSYSLYLWQQIFCRIETPHWYSRFPANVLLSIAAASASYYLLEQPLARVRAKLEKVPTSPVQG